MQTGWGRLLLMLGLVPSITISTAEGETPSGQDVLSSAVEQYNQNSGLDSAFRLLQIKSPPDWEPLNADLQKLEVILKETTCPNSGDLNLDDCDFKEHGFLNESGFGDRVTPGRCDRHKYESVDKSLNFVQVVKECSGTSSAQPGSGILQIKCDKVTEGNIRVKRRSKIRKGLRKLRKLLTGGGSLIANAKPRFHIA